MAASCARMFDAAVAGDAQQRSSSPLLALPLNLIALIVSYCDEVADLARLCRTSRVLNYMTLPQLYKDLTLTSYDRIRYRDDFPEGCGSASPFSMGLNAVVTRPNVATLVRSFALRGEWREDALEEHARVGRVPDSSMMLNIAVRVAIDKMVDLETFSWDLNTKMLETVYLGLNKLPKLTSLTIRFPSSRHPRPTVVVPPMPHLRSLKVTDIDPLCYPDDLSTLFLHSKKLRELKLHWSTRMREEQEPSVTVHGLFRKCIAAKSPLRLRKLAMQNFYAMHSDDFENAIDMSVLEDITTLCSPGVSDESTGASFVEMSWPKAPLQYSKIKSIRIDRMDKMGLEFLSRMQPLERLYIVHPVRTAADRINSARLVSPHSTTMLTPVSGDEPVAGCSGGPTNGHAAAQPSPYPTHPNHAHQPVLRDSFIQMLGSVHGTSLRHLLLPSRWVVPSNTIGRLVRSCPNLEQLALATDMSSFDTLGILMPFLRKLRAIRLLIPTGPASSYPSSNQNTPSGSKGHTQSGSEYHSGHPASTPAPGNGSVSQQHTNAARAIAEIVDVVDVIHSQALGFTLADKELYSNLRILGIGWKAWELGEYYTVKASETARHVVTGDQDSSLLDPDGSNGAGENINGVVNPLTPHYAADGSGAQSWPPGVSSPSTGPNAASSILGKRKQQPNDALHPAQPNGEPPASQSPQHPPYQRRRLHTETTAQSTRHPLQHQPSDNHQQLQSPSPENPQPRCLAFDPSRGAPTLDLSKIRTSRGEPISEFTRSAIMRCLVDPNKPMDPDELVWRRKVKRAEWDVLKDWEIWGLDEQEI